MLTFNLKKQWFNKIKSGEKTHEYRVVKKDWQERELLLKNLNILKEKAKVKNGKNHKI